MDLIEHRRVAQVNLPREAGSPDLAWLCSSADITDSAVGLHNQMLKNKFVTLCTEQGITLSAPCSRRKRPRSHVLIVYGIVVIKSRFQQASTWIE